MRMLKEVIARVVIVVALATVLSPAVSFAQVVYGNLGSSGTDALGPTNTDITLSVWPVQGLSTGTSTDLDVQ